MHHETDEYCFTLLHAHQIGDTPAHNAVKSGCAECVRVLCEYGADFTLQNRNSQSPTGIAKSLGNRRCLAAAHSTASAATVGGYIISLSMHIYTDEFCNIWQ